MRRTLIFLFTKACVKFLQKTEIKAILQSFCIKD